MFLLDKKNALNETATFSREGRYRYTLKRLLNGADAPVAFIMLNPSTADHEKNDPTIRRCIDFANQFNSSALYVVNLFAFRATSPRELKATQFPDLITYNNYAIHIVCEHVIDQKGFIICGWGNHGAYRNRARVVVDEILGDVDLFCFGHTKSNQPRHPLYLKKSASLVNLNRRM